MSQQNKHYVSTAELNQRAEIYSHNDDTIRQLNARSSASGKSNAAKYAHNAFSDMTEAEF